MPLWACDDGWLTALCATSNAAHYCRFCSADGSTAALTLGAKKETTSLDGRPCWYSFPHGCSRMPKLCFLSAFWSSVRAIKAYNIQRAKREERSLQRRAIIIYNAECRVCFRCREKSLPPPSFYCLPWTLDINHERWIPYLMMDLNSCWAWLSSKFSHNYRMAKFGNHRSP